MTLEELGYNKKIEAFRIEQKLNDFEIGRIIAEHKERYTVKTTLGEYEAEITGNMRFSAVSREDFPAVGDWVALTTYDTDGGAYPFYFLGGNRLYEVPKQLGYTANNYDNLNKFPHPFP